MPRYSSLSGALAAEREREIRRKSRDAWQRRQLKFRDATGSDAADLLRLARLDSQGRPPEGRHVVAVDDGVMVAAIEVETGATIADPFRPTAQIVALLRLRAEAMRTPAPRRVFGRFARVRGAAA